MTERLAAQGISSHDAGSGSLLDVANLPGPVAEIVRTTAPRVTAFTVSLGDVHMGPVVSPSHPHMFADGILSFAIRIDRRGAEIVWANWSRISGIAVDWKKATTYDHSYLAFEAARMGMGAAIAPRFLIEEELASGALVAPAGFLVFKEGFYVRPYDTRRGKLTKNARIFLNWLESNARLTPEGRPAFLSVEAGLSVPLPQL